MTYFVYYLLIVAGSCLSTVGLLLWNAHDFETFGILMRDGLAVIAGAIIGIGWVLALCYFVYFFGTEGIDMMKDAIKSLI